MIKKVSKAYFQKDELEAFIWTSESTDNLVPEWFLDGIKKGIINPEFYGGSDCVYIEIIRPGKDEKYMNYKFFVNPGDYICMSSSGSIPLWQKH
jgi:hypothetical protein